MQDPTEPDRQDIIDGPGDHRRSGRNPKKIVAIAASVLVAALAVGGVSYVMVSGGDTPVQMSQQAPPADQAPPAEEDAPEEKTSKGDDAPSEDAAEDTADDGVGDTADTGTADTPDTGDTADRASTDTGSAGTDARDRDDSDTGGKPAKKPTTSPSKPAPEDAADTPADGPAGAVTGQCAKSGC
jgi:hypothetical protein